jgi:hypothetical protein
MNTTSMVYFCGSGDNINFEVVQQGGLLVLFVGGVTELGC